MMRLWSSSRRPASPSPPLYESELYARELLPAGHGYPMWIPEASDNLPEEYKANGLSIGDVGIITTDGAFDVLLNITLPADHSINKHGVPPGFEQLVLGDEDILVNPNSHPPRSYVSSPTISISPDSEELSVVRHANPFHEYSFAMSDSQAQQGAVLILPEGATSMDVKSTQKFAEYAKKHTPTWYHFASVTRGRMIKPGGLHLVTGTTKARSWVVHSIPGVWEEVTTVTRQDGTVVQEKTQHFSSPSRRNSRSHEDGQPALLNQCVFMRGFTLSVRDIPGQRSGSIFDNVILEDFTTGGRGEPYHPSAVITKFLLDCGVKAEVAISHDEEWFAIFRELKTTPDNAELFNRLAEKFNIAESSGAAEVKPRRMRLPMPGRRTLSTVSRSLERWTAGESSNRAVFLVPRDDVKARVVDSGKMLGSVAIRDPEG